MNYMNFPQPALSIFKTISGFYRVQIFGPDANRGNVFYSEMDIGRGPTKEAALAQANKWFENIEDRTEDKNNITTG